VTLSPTQIEAINRFGATVANELGYRGWLQIDLIEDEYENLWLLEANPRWTAGMEILHLCGLKPAAEHLACFPELVDDLGNKVSQFADTESSGPSFAAKAIVYAQADIELTEALLKRLWSLPRRNFCDIPSQRFKGTVLEAGHPLLTVRETSSERMSVCEAVERLSGLKTLVQTTVESCS